MQRLFAEDTPWKTPWLQRVIPKAIALVRHRPEKTIFTRFIPADRPRAGLGSWRRYYIRWSEMTIESIGPDMIDLMPELRSFVPPASILDNNL